MQPTREWLTQPGGLAERLYTMRKAAGLTGDQIATTLDWPRSKVSKLENGRQMPTTADLRAWATTCGEPHTIPDLLDMLATAQTVHRQHRTHSHAAMLEDYEHLVRQATRIRSFEVTLIPGLLQTADYARCRAIEMVQFSGTSEQGIDAAVAVWMRRQEVLYETGRTFEFVLTEAALRFGLAPPQVMLGQIDRLLNLSRLNAITIGVIPFGTELPLTPLHGFLLADDITYVETYASDIVLRGEESAAYERIADGLIAEAAIGDQARQLLTDATAKLHDA